jgi:magnesium-transporting ATPase (P-type)
MKKRVIDGMWIVGAIVLASVIYATIQKAQAKKEAKKLAASNPVK